MIPPKLDEFLAKFGFGFTKAKEELLYWARSLFLYHVTPDIDKPKLFFSENGRRFLYVWFNQDKTVSVVNILFGPENQWQSVSVVNLDFDLRKILKISYCYSRNDLNLIDSKTQKLNLAALNSAQVIEEKKKDKRRYLIQELQFYLQQAYKVAEEKKSK